MLPKSDAEHNLFTYFPANPYSFSEGPVFVRGAVLNKTLQKDPVVHQ